MKAICIKAVCALLLVAFFAASCTNEVDYPVEPQNSKVSYDNLQMEIKKLNQTFSKQGMPTSPTLKDGPFLKRLKKALKWFAVIGSDALATVAGGGINITAGASASVNTAKRLKLIRDKNEIAATITINPVGIAPSTGTLNPDQPFGTLPWYEQNGGDAGQKHNLIIGKVYLEEGNNFFNMSEEEIIAAVNKSAEDLSIPSRSQEEIKNIVNVFQYAYDNCEGLEDFSSYICQRFPEQEEEIGVITEVIDYMQYVDPDESNDLYMNCAFNIVNNSTLPEISKTNIRSAISVANASAHLWVIDNGTIVEAGATE